MYIYHLSLQKIIIIKQNYVYITAPGTTDKKMSQHSFAS